ncbi:hypothetical protein H4582DRAFT_615773 [Lactarius indigo]|nr:hypothetical protein H4582DRAFT_615773 [Lactarius indigo]
MSSACVEPLTTVQEFCQGLDELSLLEGFSAGAASPLPTCPPRCQPLLPVLPSADRLVVHPSMFLTSACVLCLFHILFEHPGQAPEGSFVDIRMRSSACPHLPWVRSYDDCQSQSPVLRQPFSDCLIRKRHSVEGGGWNGTAFVPNGKRNRFLHTGTTCSTSPRSGHRQRARQMVKCRRNVPPFAVRYYHYPTYLIDHPR